MLAIQKMDFMTNEESFIQRRQLFKNIWKTAMNIDEKEDILNKPKIIKTLRLDEVDKCIVGKKKKQRIKNLRHVCNRILDFCDRQDADDIYYEQMAADGQEPGQMLHKVDVKPPMKMKPHKGKKKVVKAKSMFTPTSNDLTQVKGSVSEGKDELTINAETKTSRHTSPNSVRRTTFVKNSFTSKVKSKTSSRKIGEAGSTSFRDTKAKSNHATTSHRRPVRKRVSKRKKPLEFDVLPTGQLMRVNYHVSRRFLRAPHRPARKQLHLTKVTLN